MSSKSVCEQVGCERECVCGGDGELARKGFWV